MPVGRVLRAWDVLAEWEASGLWDVPVPWQLSREWAAWVAGKPSAQWDAVAALAEWGAWDALAMGRASLEMHPPAEGMDWRNWDAWLPLGAS